MAMTLGDIVVNIKSDTSQLTKGFKRAESIVSKTSRTMTNTIKTLTAAYIGLNAIDLVSNLGKQADAMTNIESKLKLVTKSTDELVSTQSELFKISQNTRTQFIGTVDLFSRVARSTKDYNIEQKELLSLTETINKSMIISGGTAESMNAAIIQLGQAFSADFQAVGQELASIREQTPRLYEAMLKGTNMSSKAFKKAAEDGELSSKIIIDALKSQGLVIDEEFSKITKTIGTSSTQLSNSFTNIIGQFDDLTGVSISVSESISSISESIDEIKPEDIKEFINQVKILSATFVGTVVIVKAYTEASKLAIATNALLGGSFGAVNRSILIATVSSKALSLAIKAIPFVAIAGTIALITNSLLESSKASNELEESLSKTGKQLSELTKNQLEYRKLVLEEELQKAYMARQEAIVDAAHQSFLESDKDHKEDLKNKDESIQKFRDIRQAIFEVSKALEDLNKPKSSSKGTTDKTFITDADKIEADLANGFEEGIDFAIAQNKRLYEQRLKEEDEWQKAVIDFWGEDDWFEDSTVDMGEIMQANLASAITNGIQAGFEDGDIQGVISGFASGVGNAISQAYIAEMIKAGAITGGGLAGLGLGVGVMAFSTLFNEQDERSAAEKATESFNIFIEGLDKASEALEQFGNVGSSIENQITSLQQNIAKYSAITPTDIGKEFTYSRDVADYAFGIFTGYTSVVETVYKANFDGRTFEGDSRASVEAQINDYKNSLVEASESELSVVVRESLSETLDLSMLSVTQLQNLTAGIDIEKMKAYETELNNIALSMKLGTDTAEDQARATEILTDAEFAYYKDFADAIDLVGESTVNASEAMLSAQRQIDDARLGSLSYLTDLEKLQYANNIYAKAITPEDRIASSRTIAEISRGTTRTREDFIPVFQRYINEIEKQGQEATLTDVNKTLTEIKDGIDTLNNTTIGTSIYGTGTGA